MARAPPRSRLTSEQYEARHSTTFHVAGRHVFNLWRIMRSEVTLGNYTFENVVFNVLGRRVPKYSLATLSEWCKSKAPNRNLSFLQHLIRRTATNIDLLNQSEMLTKTACVLCQYNEQLPTHNVMIGNLLASSASTSGP